jgi:hypothetical protein
MSSEREARTSALLEESSPSIPESPLEQGFLNPTLLDGAPGAVRVAKRRIGILIAALSAQEPAHPVLAPDDLRDTVREELLELEAILEAIEREMEREEKKAAASIGKAE